MKSNICETSVRMFYCLCLFLVLAIAFLSVDLHMLVSLSLWQVILCLSLRINQN